MSLAPPEILALRAYVEANTVKRPTRRELYRENETWYRHGVEEAIVAAQSWLTERETAS